MEFYLLIYLLQNKCIHTQLGIQFHCTFMMEENAYNIYFNSFLLLSLPPPSYPYIVHIQAGVDNSFHIYTQMG